MMLSEFASSLKMSLNGSFDDLVPVEKRFIDKCREASIECSFDCTAHEPFNFKTLNYTTYAGMFVMHPLQPELAMVQVYDGFGWEGETADFAKWGRERFISGECEKYVLDSRETDNFNYDRLVVLSGGNKADKVDVGKLRSLVTMYGKRLAVKPHPISDDEFIGAVNRTLEGAEILDHKSSLYDHFDVDVIYTSHCSESAFYGHILGKQLKCIDLDSSRAYGSFAHINYQLFMRQQDRSWLNKVFSSPCSGIINPSIEPKWEEKMDLYFEYILNLKRSMSFAFC